MNKNGHNPDRRPEQEGLESASGCECINEPWSNVSDPRLSVLNEISGLSMEIQMCQNSNLSNPMMRQQMKMKVINLNKQLIAKRIELESMCQCIGTPCTNAPDARLAVMDEISDLSMEIHMCQTAKLSNPMMRQKMKMKALNLDERLVAKRLELASMCQHISTSYTSCTDANVVRLTSLDETINSLSTTRAQLMNKVSNLDRQLREKKRERDSASERNVLDAYTQD
jgi:hypothetical protein